MQKIGKTRFMIYLEDGDCSFPNKLSKILSTHLMSAEIVGDSVQT